MTLPNPLKEQMRFWSRSRLPPFVIANCLLDLVVLVVNSERTNLQNPKHGIMGLVSGVKTLARYRPLATEVLL
jgi:hypothetical protein